MASWIWIFIKKVIDEIKDLSSRITLNQQGEPLLHPNIMEMIEYGKKAGLSVSLLTNGTRLTPEYTEKLIELGLDRIVFSFDAIDKETYEAVRVKSEFQSTLKKCTPFH